MPYVHLRTDKPLGEETIRALCQAIIEDLGQHLSKPPERCMVQIDAAQHLAMGDGQSACAFAEVRVRGPIDTAASDAFGAAFKRDVAACLSVEAARVYLHVMEMKNGEIKGAIY